MAKLDEAQPFLSSVKSTGNCQSPMARRVSQYQSGAATLVLSYIVYEVQIQYRPGQIQCLQGLDAWCVTSNMMARRLLNQLMTVHDVAHNTTIDLNWGLMQYVTDSKDLDYSPVSGLCCNGWRVRHASPATLWVQSCVSLTIVSRMELWYQLGLLWRERKG